MLFLAAPMNAQHCCWTLLRTGLCYKSLFWFQVWAYWWVCSVSKYDQGKQSYWSVIRGWFMNKVLQAFVMPFSCLATLKAPGHLVGRLACALATTRLTLQLVEDFFNVHNIRSLHWGPYISKQFVYWPMLCKWQVEACKTKMNRDTLSFFLENYKFHYIHFLHLVSKYICSFLWQTWMKLMNLEFELSPNISDPKLILSKSLLGYLKSLNHFCCGAIASSLIFIMK